MSRLFLSLLVFLGLGFISLPVRAAELPNHPLITLSKEKRGPRVKYALDNGAQVGLTSDGKSFYVAWFPEGTNLKDLPPVLVTISGHEGWAFEDFHVWHEYLKRRGYGFISVQWWLGSGDKTSDYLTPRELYRAFDEVLKSWNVKPGRALLHGFSRGSANIYPVAALDRYSKNNYFALFIANAGKPNSNYPPVGEVEKGAFGEKPLEGTKWVTFAGGKDANWARDGVQGMREAGDWIRKYGGEVVLAIEDPETSHSGFHKNPKNAEAALDIFDKLVK